MSGLSIKGRAYLGVPESTGQNLSIRGIAKDVPPAPPTLISDDLAPSHASGSASASGSPSETDMDGDKERRRLIRHTDPVKVMVVPKEDDGSAFDVPDAPVLEIRGQAESVGRDSTSENGGSTRKRIQIKRPTAPSAHAKVYHCFFATPYRHITSPKQSPSVNRTELHENGDRSRDVTTESDRKDTRRRHERSEERLPDREKRHSEASPRHFVSLPSERERSRGAGDSRSVARDDRRPDRSRERDHTTVGSRSAPRDERPRDRSRERDHRPEQQRGGDSERSRDREREREKEGRRDRDRDKEKEREKGKERTREQDRERARHGHRDRDSARDKDGYETKDVRRPSEHSRCPARDEPKHRRESHQSRRSRSDSESEDSEEERRRRKKRKEKERRREEDEREERRRARKEKERKDDDREKAKKRRPSSAISNGSYGKYGVITETDQIRMTFEFRAWLVEQRRLDPNALSREKTNKEFATFVEDFNTATLPHEKYYNMVQHQKRMAASRNGETVAEVLQYDPRADEKAHVARLRATHLPDQADLTREEIVELRRLEKERVEAVKRRQLGLEIPKGLGVRTVEVPIESWKDPNLF